MLARLRSMNNSMRKRRSVKWFRLLLGPVAWILLLAISVRPSSTESVREELIRRQAQTGLTLAWVDREALAKSIWTHNTLGSGVQAITFKKRTIVPLKASLEVFRPDGFSSAEYPEVPGLGTCWSHDQTKLVDTMIEHPSGRATLEIIDLGSKRTHAIAKGTDPTWSPDGNWIAFRDRETYYAMHPDGSGRKELFHNHWGSAVSGLYWSPDSRIVAYVRELGFLQGGALDAEVNQLRARRLEDGSEDRLCPDNVAAGANYRWITTSELKQPGSGSPH